MREGWNVLNFLCAAAALFASVMLAAPAGAETWKCDGGFGHSGTVTVTADHEAGSGTIAVNGRLEIETRFHVRGLNLYWHWTDGNNERFGFSISPDDVGGYYEFANTTDKVPPKLRYRSCERLE